MIQGLIVSDMLKTAEKLINNFITMIGRFGFIPNLFSEQISTSVFSLMVKELVEAYRLKGDHERADSLEKKVFFECLSSTTLCLRMKHHTLSNLGNKFF